MCSGCHVHSSQCNGRTIVLSMNALLLLPVQGPEASGSEALMHRSNAEGKEHDVGPCSVLCLCFCLCLGIGIGNQSMCLPVDHSEF